MTCMAKKGMPRKRVFFFQGLTKLRTMLLLSLLFFVVVDFVVDVVVVVDFVVVFQPC